jgi:hypothetical protein
MEKKTLSILFHLRFKKKIVIKWEDDHQHAHQHQAGMFKKN